MRRKDRKIHDDKILNEILTKSLICRVGLFDEEYPYVVPLNFGYKNNALFFHCAPQGKKIDLIKKNNNVCFEIEQRHKIIREGKSCDWTAKYRSIIGFGQMEIIEDKEEKIKALDIIMQQHGKNDNEYSDHMLNKTCILKLIIDSYEGKMNE